MKKSILSVLAFLFCASFVQAQELKFGVKGGANITTINGDLNVAGGILKFDLGGSYIFGYHVGGMLSLPLGEKLAIQPEAYFSSEGTRIENNSEFLKNLLGNTFNEGDVTLNLSYVNVPVYLKFYPVESFALMAGPQFGILVGSEEKVEVAGLSTNVNALNSSYNDVNFGLNFGAQYESPIGLTVGASYNLGLSNSVETIGLQNILNLDNVRNQTIQISLGWFLFGN